MACADERYVRQKSPSKECPPGEYNALTHTYIRPPSPGAAYTQKKFDDYVVGKLGKRYMVPPQGVWDPVRYANIFF